MNLPAFLCCYSFASSRWTHTCKYMVGGCADSGMVCCRGGRVQHW